MNNNRAFAEKEPSLFIVQTPFQAMCALNAIRQLKIEDYTISLHLHKNTAKRNKQTIELVERYGLKYSVAKTSPISLFKLIGLFFKRKGWFNRVFLGTHLYHDGYYYALKVMKRKGNLVLLDDGVATLSLLEGDYKTTGMSAIYMAMYKAIAKLRGIKLNNVFTVYKDILNPRWNIAFNNISLLRQFKSSSEEKIVYFIGTNNSGFIERRGVDEVAFKQMLYNVLKRMRAIYPSDKIIYIPHGRDKSTFVKDYCEEFGFEFRPLDVNVEIYILSQDIIPQSIYGFTSSALYNLKMIFPETKVKNIVMKLLTEKSPGIIGISDYYAKNGIPTLTV